jgi:hypothetical protein
VLALQEGEGVARRLPGGRLRRPPGGIVRIQTVPPLVQEDVGNLPRVVAAQARRLLREVQRSRRRLPEGVARRREVDVQASAPQGTAGPVGPLQPHVVRQVDPSLLVDEVEVVEGVPRGVGVARAARDRPAGLRRLPRRGRAVGVGC